ncbi:MAG: TIGR01777 family protein [Acidobacteria bacterium]|nr:MAG: TIGR01777 family protein [Acidobacteriota bacterium]
MKVLITGSTGLVGTALVKALVRDGHTVCRLVRPQSVTSGGAKEGFDVAWSPVTGELGGAGVGADAVVNLAGASIAEGRWTQERKELLRASRIDTTRALVNALAKTNVRPRVLVSASAIGIYGSRGDEVLTEESKPGTEFLADLAREWEAEAIKAEALGIRVVLARFGIILARHGGALPRMILPFKLGVGGRVGPGKQWVSWITLEDVVAIIRLAMENETVRGAVNVAAPNAVQNADFTKVLAQALHRPALFPAPAFALRLALGEMADALLLSSQRVKPQALQRLGYRFLHSELSAAMNAILQNG